MLAPCLKRFPDPRIGFFILLMSVICLAILAADHPCGDGACEGPENSTNCPEDCGVTASDIVPNPLRAIVSDDLLVWRNWSEDGGFERGMDAVVVLDHPAAQLSLASVTRSSDAARSDGYGVRIESAAGEGVLFALRAKIEKGESTRCTFWVRSADEPVQLEVIVLGVESGQAEPRPMYTANAPFEIDTEWTEVQFTFDNTRGVDYALFAVDIGPGRTIDIDDVAVEAEQWAPPSVCRLERTVGGIQVPLTAVTPVHFNVLIHIEDPRLITRNEQYFRLKTTVFRELARVLHEHGGFLAIQPEEDWPTAALAFAPTTLSDLARDYGVVFSTHTHGPACLDADGRLRSNQDCNECRTCPGWREIEIDTDPCTPEYIGALRELISDVSGTEVTDHNGNFHYGNTEALAEAGISTWSAFKDHNTQSTFDQLFTNPWRPSECDAIESPETFQTHDPRSSVIFVPGWGQAITRHPERLHDRLAAMLAQVLCHADPDRINTFYIVTHVDHYKGEDGEPYLEVDESTGRVTLHEAFTRDLGYWDETLTELIDPLVAEGYLQWTSLPEIGRLFLEWEAESGSDKPS